MSSLIFAFLLCVVVVSAVDVPKGYILDVTADCGKKLSDKPVLKIITDLDIKAEAKCVGGDIAFKTVDRVHYTAEASYTIAGGSGKCVLKSTKSTHTAKVVVMFGNPGGHLLTNKEIFTVSCTLDDTGEITSTSTKTKNGRIAFKETVYNTGKSVAKGYITLQLQDVRKKEVKGSIPMDKWVSIYASTPKKNGEKGLKAISCYAINSAKKEYGILRSGCGDGLVIPKTVGFVTNGTEVRSPFFKSFLIEDDASISYRCSFALCTSACDGTSCT